MNVIFNLLKKRRNLLPQLSFWSLTQTSLISKSRIKISLMVVWNNPSHSPSILTVNDNEIEQDAEFRWCSVVSTFRYEICHQFSVTRIWLEQPKNLGSWKTSICCLKMLKSFCSSQPKSEANSDQIENVVGNCCHSFSEGFSTKGFTKNNYYRPPPGSTELKLVTKSIS